jgi:aspartyl-tRNA(Asn)/glutamyl-tRNA(Gln) amidotransferase subunit C
MDKDTILHVCDICKIEVSQEELEKLKVDFEKILGYFSKIEQVESEEENIFIVSKPREDMVKESTHDVLRNAPKVEDKYVKVPKNL